MKIYKIATIPGDGIGKEVVPAGREVLEALAAAGGTFGFEFAEHLTQRASFSALQTEGASEIGFIGFSCLAQKAQQGFLVGKAAGRRTGRAAGSFGHESRLARIAETHHETLSPLRPRGGTPPLACRAG